MNLVRKIKIDNIIPTLTDDDHEIIDFIENQLNNLDTYNTICYSKYTFYMNSDYKWIFLHDFILGEVYIRYENFCQILMEKYHIKYKDLRSILKFFIDKNFKINLLSECNYNSYTFQNYNDIEKDFKEKELNK